MLTRIQRHPSAFNTKPQGPHDTLDVGSIEHVSLSLADKARFYSLIACTAAYRGSLDEEDQKGRAAFYLGRALVVVREQLHHNAFVKKDSLYALVNMAICAQFLGDYPASLAHLRAAKFVVDREGGFSSLEVPIVRLTCSQRPLPSPAPSSERSSKSRSIPLNM